MCARSLAPVDELLDSEGNLDAPSAMDGMRGTNFVVCLRWLREHQLEARYLAALSAPIREIVLSADVSSWQPVNVALAHYAALDALPFTYEQRVDFGAEVSRSINGFVLATVAKLAGSVGLSPFTPLARSAKLFARNFRGGAVGVYKVGPSEARFEVLGVPIAASASHRDNICGAILDGARPFASDVRVNEINHRRTPTSYAIRIRW